MTRQTFIRSAVVLMVCAAGLTASVSAQQQLAAPLKVDIVLTRYQGDKKTSSLPFTVYVNANTNTMASLRLGVDVPIGTSTVTSGSGNNDQRSGSTTSMSTTSNKVDYRNVGTSIDGRATQLPDGRFNLDLRIQDSSVFTKDADAKTPQALDPAAFRTLTFSNTLPMRDGQTLLWATGTDKITGETLKIDVTLTVVK